MSKAPHLSLSIPASPISSTQSRFDRRASAGPARSVPKKSAINELIPVALFSGIGLLISLVAIALGVQGVWY